MITTIYINRIDSVMGGVVQHVVVHGDVGIDHAYIAGNKPPHYRVPLVRDTAVVHYQFWDLWDWTTAASYCELIEEAYWGEFQ